MLHRRLEAVPIITDSSLASHYDYRDGTAQQTLGEAVAQGRKSHRTRFRYPEMAPLQIEGEVVDRSSRMSEQIQDGYRTCSGSQEHSTPQQGRWQEDPNQERQQARRACLLREDCGRAQKDL